MPKRVNAKGSTRIAAIVHKEDQRTNIPTAELEAFLKNEDRQPRVAKYARPAELLYPRDPAADPQLVWRGKDQQDRDPLVVAAPPIYIQEKIHPKAIIEALRAENRGETEEQANLFSDFNEVAFDDLVDFYKHGQNWSNRMILGDSLQVMASLSEKEGLKGQVQCIYVDPPYGIKFGSNWQVSTRHRDVTDGRAEDTTRQPEQVKAFRDTWELGIHSYLTYLRDRLVVAATLLAPGGSVFVQIGDENIHLVRCLLDEILGSKNFVSLISFKKTGGQSSNALPGVTDYLLWYSNKIEVLKYRPIYFGKQPGAEGAKQYNWIELPDHTRRPMTSSELDGPLPLGAQVFQPYPLVSMGESKTDRPFVWNDREYHPSPNSHWKTTAPGLDNLARADRLLAIGNTLRFVNYLDDYSVTPYTNFWVDTQTSGFAAERLFVVQTLPAVIQRCLLMTTDPGDLVLDPTCGSGTTAYVAERWGRRWITIDTSRVALTLARQRLMSAKFPYYVLADPNGDLRRGFRYQTAKHVTLGSIANNPEIHDGMSREDLDKAISKHAERETLYDQPDLDKATVRVTGPFTVESLSPLLGLSDKSGDSEGDDSARDDARSFETVITDNLRRAGVQNTVKQERLAFLSLVPWPGRFIHAVGDYSENNQAKRAAICIGPQYGTVDADLVRDAAKEAAGHFDILVVCGFAFDAYISTGFKQFGNLTVIKAAMNPDLSMGGDLLKKTGAGNLFTVFGEPDIVVARHGGQLVVEIRGVDVFDPTTGEIRSHTTDDIACWFIDTDYNAESFFIRHAYFIGANNPYVALKRALKADIDDQAWATLNSTKSRPFATPKAGKIAVKVINHFGDEVMKVYAVAEEVKYPLAENRPLLRVAEKPDKRR